MSEGGKATKPSDPTKAGYVFDDWYADATFETVFDFDTEIEANTTIYAKWIETVEHSMATRALPSQSTLGLDIENVDMLNDVNIEQGNILSAGDEAIQAAKTELLTALGTIPQDGGYSLYLVDSTSKYQYVGVKVTNSGVELVIDSIMRNMAQTPAQLKYDFTGGKWQVYSDDYSVYADVTAEVIAYVEARALTITGIYFGATSGEDTAKCEALIKFLEAAIDSNLGVLETERIFVSFDMDGGTYVLPEPADLETDLVESPFSYNGGSSAFVKDGYTFSAFYTEDTFETEIDFNNDTFTEDATIYAKWTEEAASDTYTISFIDVDGSGNELSDGGSVEEPITVSDGTILTREILPSNPYKEGYEIGEYYANSISTQYPPYGEPVTNDMTLYIVFNEYVEPEPDEIDENE